MKSDLSVIIPNYNKVDYIRACVESVVKQTLLPDEIIIIDDCSTDGSKEEIVKIEREYPIVTAIFNEKNQGVSHARNVGLKQSKTKYVSFLDSDDFYCNSSKLENEMHLLRERGDNFLTYSKVVQANVMGEIVFRPTDNAQLYLRGNVYEKLLTGQYNMAVRMRDYCIRREHLINVGGYNENMNLYEDFDLVIRLSKNVQWDCTFEEGTAYRIVSNGLSSQSSHMHKKVIKEITDSYINEYPSVKKRNLKIIRKAMDIKHAAETMELQILGQLIKIRDVLFRFKNAS